MCDFDSGHEPPWPSSATQQEEYKERGDVKTQKAETEVTPIDQRPERPETQFPNQAWWDENGKQWVIVSVPGC